MSTQIVSTNESGRYIYLGFDGEQAFAKRKDDVYIPKLMEAFFKVVDKLSHDDLVKYVTSGIADLSNPKTDWGNGQKYMEENLPEWFEISKIETYSDEKLRLVLKSIGQFKCRSHIEHMTMIFGIDQTITEEQFKSLARDVSDGLDSNHVKLDHLMPPPPNPDCPRFSMFPLGLCPQPGSKDWNKVAGVQIAVQMNPDVNPYHPDRPDAKTPLEKASAGFKKAWEACQRGDREGMVDAFWPHTTLCFLLTGLQELYLEAASQIEIQDEIVLSELGMSIRPSEGDDRYHCEKL